jgi:hypothetical protein
MDESRFDALVRAFSSGTTRRDALRGLAAGGAALAASATTLGEAAAKKKKHHHKRNKHQCKGKPDGAACTTNKECCTKTTKRICAVAFNASNSDTTCCGGTGAKCGGVDDNGDVIAPVCCTNFVCSSNDMNNPGVPGTCQPVPPMD